jgi:PAS domain S-box-containing protein
MQQNQTKRLSLYAILVITVALFVIVGWLANIPFLMSVFPGYISMTFNTALSFILTGTVLYLTVNDIHIILARSIAVVVIVFAATILLQDIVGVAFGIDELFIKDESIDTLKHGIPGRMAPSTAFNFICLNLSFLLFSIKKKRVVVFTQSLFYLVTVISFMAILGYMFSTPILYKLSFLTSMAVHTALLFFITSIAASLLRPSVGLVRVFTGNQLGDVLARKIFPLMLGIFVLFAYLRILSFRYALISVESGIAIYTAIIVLSVLIILFRTANWINLIDAKRTTAEFELRKINATLAELVAKRTEELNAIFDAAHVSIMVADRNGLITHFNRGAEQMLGYAAKEVVGKQTPLLFHDLNEVAQRAVTMSKEFGHPVSGFDVFVQPIIKQSYVSTNWTYVKKDGTSFPVQLVVTPMKNGANKIGGFLGIAIDVSDLYNTKEDLSVLANHLQKKNAKLLNFAHVASHNLRSPAGNLKALLQFYKWAENQEEKDQLFEKIETVSASLSETLNNLVDSLKYQEDTEVKMEHLSFATVFDKIKQDITGQILQSDAQITTDFSKLPFINYPKDYLESILLNLLTNAIKYRSEERPLQVKIETEIRLEKPVLIFSDNGLGIDMDKFGNKLFGLNKTFHGNAEAKGVGLFITKTQVEAMGGTIAVNSKLNEGTTFTIEFSPNNQILHHTQSKLLVGGKWQPQTSIVNDSTIA